MSGCKGSRKELKPQVEEIRLQLIGLKEHAIRSLLGKPDTEELLQKSNKIYIYYINPGPKCANPSGAGDVAALAVRIDALGTVIESNILEE
ncbi:hypothetical protein ACFQHR_19725 [Rufibacter roseus]|uniref:Uncharacterized protein n=1 Tax=Rufibacter roseus TaxID=1567108 RepID=A0ABW2DQ31_9BACT